MTETTPTPDPTILVTELVRHEVDVINRDLAVRASTRERELEAAQKLTEVRLAAMDKATELRLDVIRGVPELIEKACRDQDRLVDEKFGGISLQFKERDTRTLQAAETSQKALDAALLAAAALVNQQNEANATAATVQTLSFTKQIDQIIVLTERQQKSSDDRLAELKERIDRGDGSNTGSKTAQGEAAATAAALVASALSARTEKRADSSQMVAIIGVILIVVSIVSPIALALVLKP